MLHNFEITSKLEAISLEAVSWFLKRQAFVLETQRMEAMIRRRKGEEEAGDRSE